MARLPSLFESTDAMRKKARISILPLTVALSLIALTALVTSWLASGSGEARTVKRAEAASVSTLVTDPSCRYGLSTLENDLFDQLAYVDDLEAGWLIHFGKFIDPPVPSTEVVRLVTVKQKKQGSTYLNDYVTFPSLNSLEQVVTDFPGQLWMVGSEVDRGPDPGAPPDAGQGDTFPNVFARAYHDVYQRIKSADPTAQVANAALVEVTPGRLQYLDLVWEAYLDRYKTPMSVDVWNMHVYVLPEARSSGEPNNIANIALGTDPALAKIESDGDQAKCPLDKVYCFAEHDDIDRFSEQILDMRKWMYEHGQRSKPLILTEWSMIYPATIDGVPFVDEYGDPFDTTRVKEFLIDSTGYLETATHSQYGFPADNNRLVQQWNWFSIFSDNVGSLSNLVDPDSASLTQVGQAFRQKALAQQPGYVNLYPISLGPTAFPVDADGLTDVLLSVTMVNNGTIALDSGFDVTFYANKGLTEVIATAAVPPPGQGFPGLVGCARRQTMAQTIWHDVPPGEHRYWVKIDSNDVVQEDDPSGQGETDNVLSGIVTIVDFQSFAPLVIR